MRENLYYLLVAGILMGSGPCLGFCAPFLVAYMGVQKKTFRQSLLSYGFFCAGKMISYAILGFLCALGTLSLQSSVVMWHAHIIYLILGVFIMCLGIASALRPSHSSLCCLPRQEKTYHMAVVGFLVGLSPCLPLIGMLHYIALIARTPYEAAGLTMVFGLGTVASPVIVLMVCSGGFARAISQWKSVSYFFHYLLSALIVFLGVAIARRAFG